MKEWSTIGLDLASVFFEYATMVLFILAFSQNAISLKSKKLLIFFPLFGFAGFTSLVRFMPLMFASTIVAVVLVARFCFDLRKTHLLVVSLLYLILVGTSEGIAGYLIASIEGISVYEMEQLSKNSYKVSVTMDLIELFATGLFALFRKGKLGAWSRPLWILGCLLPLVSLGMMAVFFVVCSQLSFPQTPWLIVEGFGFLLINITVFCLIEILVRRGERDRLNAALEMRQKVQQNQVQYLTEKRETEQHERHNFKQKATGLLALLDANNLDRLREVLQKDVEKADSIYFNTGNLFFDATVSVKRGIAVKKGIRCRWEISIQPELATLTMDICAMIGNALDNAIEACEKLNSDERWIKFNIRLCAERLLVVVRNPMCESPTPQGAFLKTNKSDPEQHGIGLKSMKRAVLNVGGSFQFSTHDNVFDLRVSLPVYSVAPDDSLSNSDVNLRLTP